MSCIVNKVSGNKNFNIIAMLALTLRERSRKATKAFHYSKPTFNALGVFMITTWLPAENIQIVDSVSDWKQAIRLSSQPLLAKETITEEYITAIFNSHQELGPYYVLAPGLAMPHARPEQGAIKNGLSLLHIKQGVSFDAEANDPVYVVIMLCALSGDEHINMITALADIFSDDERLSALLKASSMESIQSVING